MIKKVSSESIKLPDTKECYCVFKPEVNFVYEQDYDFEKNVIITGERRLVSNFREEREKCFQCVVKEKKNAAWNQYLLMIAKHNHNPCNNCINCTPIDQLVNSRAKMKKRTDGKKCSLRKCKECYLYKKQAHIFSVDKVLKNMLASSC